MGDVFALTAICFSVSILICASFVYSTASTLPLHAVSMFTASFLLLVFLLVRARLIDVRHDLLLPLLSSIHSDI